MRKMACFLPEKKADSGDQEHHLQPTTTETEWRARHDGDSRGAKRRCSHKMLAAVGGYHDNGKCRIWGFSRGKSMDWCVGTETSH